MSTFSLCRTLAVAAGHSDAADGQMVGRIRLVLAGSALLTFFVDSLGMRGTGAIVPFVLSGYLATSVAMWVCSELGLPFALGRLMHWVDVAWFFGIVASTGGGNSFLFLFFFFAILVSSLRWGLDEGARVTIASVALFISCAVINTADFAPARLLLRSSFLLVLGCLIAQLGERQIQLNRRLALLSNLNQLSNPRFGIDRTITAMLEKTRDFFAAERCVIVLHKRKNESFSIRTVHSRSALTVLSEAASAALARALLPEPRSQILLYRCPWHYRIRLGGVSSSHAAGAGRWTRHSGPRFEHLADLLDARSFISAPLVLACGSGRIYVASPARRFDRDDALFLAHIVAQELPVVGNIELLDRIASDAASHERKKIALDLHDTALQPYIGLRLGLAAVCKRADPANPVIDDLFELLAMTDNFIDQLRTYACGIGSEVGGEESLCLTALRRQTSQLMQCYGIDIKVAVDGRIAFGDRITAEVLHIVREGLSNICRHTVARSAEVRVHCSDGILHIEIENENGGKAPLFFLPRSISERAVALGGTAYVRQGLIGSTGVCVEIPV